LPGRFAWRWASVFRFCACLSWPEAADGGAVPWVLLVAREVMVGVVMGFVGACMFRAAEAAGQFTDVLRGASMAEVLSPTGEGKSSPLGA
jgi:type III secretory pathway component EscT